MENRAAIARMFNFSPRTFYRFSPLIVGLFLTFGQSLWGGPQRQQSSRAKTSTATAVPVSPFHIGEDLTYSGEWLRMSDVISAQVTVAGDSPFFGHPAWHLKVQFHTRNPLRYLAAVDDQFDSYSDHSDLSGYQFEMYTHQSGKSETRILRLSPTQSPAPPDAIQVQVLPGTRDPLGFAYFLRTINWEKTREVRSPVYDGHRLYEVRAEVASPREEITVLAGKYSATGISIHVFDHGTEKSDLKITVWLAQDESRTPVLLEIETALSSGRIELVQKGAAH
jgi:hypothetical protein